MKLYPVLLVLLLSVQSSAQEDKMYKQLSWQANAYYQNKDYKRSAEAYESAIALKGDKAGYMERYNAACAWSLAGDTARAFMHLFYLANTIMADPEKTFGKDHMDPFTYMRDKDFEPLHKYERWDEFMRILRRRRSVLVNALDSIYLDDQASRSRMQEVQTKYGFGSDELNALGDEMQRLDSINLVKVKQIIDTFGWPGVDSVGRRGNSTVFLVIQHAGLETQEEYLPIMRKAVKDGNAYGRDLAMLEDRVALANGQPQKYGTQVYRMGGSPWFLRPLQDPDSVDIWRKEVGLGRLYFYLRKFDINWDVEEYKRTLPELMATEQRIQGD